MLLAGGEWIEQHAGTARPTVDGRELDPGESSGKSPLQPTAQQRYSNENPGELRTGCVWAGPGEQPYVGTLLDALTAARLPSEIIRKLVMMHEEGFINDRLEISRAGIHSADHRRSFGYTTKAMALDGTVCFNTKIDLSNETTGSADLYEVTDRNYQRYTIMIVANGGNVAVLQEQSGR